MAAHGREDEHDDAVSVDVAAADTSGAYEARFLVTKKVCGCGYAGAMCTHLCFTFYA